MKKITGVKGPTIEERRGHYVEADAEATLPLLVNPRDGWDVANNQVNQQCQLLTSYLKMDLIKWPILSSTHVCYNDCDWMSSHF